MRPGQILRRGGEDGVSERLLQRRDLRWKLLAVVLPDHGLGHDDELCEGPVAIDAEDLRVLAHVRAARAAVEAHPARDVALGRDVVAANDGAHVLAHLDDGAGKLVTERQRRLDARLRPVVPLEDVQIGAADARRLDLDEHVVRAGLGDRHPIENETRLTLQLADRPHRLHAVEDRLRPWGGHQTSPRSHLGGFPDEGRPREPARSRAWSCLRTRSRSIEPIQAAGVPSTGARAIIAAGFNTFLLRSDDVYIDLLTDSGTSAVSQEQRAAMELGDESYAGSRSFYRLEAAMREVYGWRHLIPTHQGRGAEHLLSRVLVQPGQLVLSNLYFTTSRVHAELAGGVWTDVSIPEARRSRVPASVQGEHRPRQAARPDRARRARADRVRAPGGVPQHGRRPAVLAREPARGPRAHAGARRAVLPRRDALLGERRSSSRSGSRDRPSVRCPRSSARSRRSPTAPCSRRRRTISSRSAASSPRTTMPSRGRRASSSSSSRASRTTAGSPATTWKRSPRGFARRQRSRRSPITSDRCATSPACSSDAGVPIVEPGRRARRLPGCEAVPPAPAAGAVPGSDAGRRDLRRGRCPLDGAWHRLGPARRRAVRRPRARAADDSAARLQP